MPARKRKALLKRILPKDNTSRVRYTDHMEAAAKSYLRSSKLEALKLEGMVMKRKDTVYASSRSRHWLKVKTTAGRMTIKKRIETWG